MKRKLLFRSLIVAIAVLFTSYVYSQQEFTIDNTGAGDYETFTAAFEYLNILGTTTEAITFNVVAGQEFDEDIPVLSVVGSEEFPVIFQKSGDGENPILKPTMNIGPDDGVITFTSASFVTFDGIDVTDPNSTDEFYYESGYYVSMSDNISILNCSISNFGKYGVYCRYGSHDIIVDNNDIYYTEDFFPSESTIYGFSSNMYSTIIENIEFTNNRLWGLDASSSIYYIRFNRSGGLIANNFVSHFGGQGGVAGIRIDAAATEELSVTDNIYHNTINFEGEMSSSTVGLYTSGTLGNINFKNNIISNNSINSDETTSQIAFWITTPEIMTPTIDFDYNMYFCGDEENDFYCRWGASSAFVPFDNLETWKTTTGYDFHSSNYSPTFVDAANCDLHLNDDMEGNFIFAGTGVPEVTTDFDGEERDPEYPYVGADENIDLSLNIHVSVAPLTLEFGDVYTSLHSDLNFDIINDGENPVTVNEISFSQTEIPFSLSADDGLTWIDAIPEFEILNGESKNIIVRFSPLELSSFEFLTNVYLGNDQVLEIPTTGNALPMGMEINSYTFDFGAVQINNDSEIQVLTIENISEDDLLIPSISVPEGFFIREEGTDSWSDEIIDLNVLVGETKNIEMIFQPLEQVDYSGILTINGTVEILVELLGRGREIEFEITELGEPTYYGSTALADFDNDGDLDIFAAGYSMNGSITKLYRNEGNMEFSNVSCAVAGIGAGTINAIDYDNDNDIDIFVCGQLEFGVIISRLYKNDGGIFTEASRDFVALQVPSSDWADFDADGDLDFIITGKDTTEFSEDNFTYIYENIGNDEFEVYQILEGYNNGEVEWADYDNDGDQDFAITGRIESGVYRSKVFENQDGEFVEVANLLPVRYSKLDWGDYDNDGDLDLIVSGSITAIDTDFLPAISAIYRNDGNNTFTNINADILAIQYGDLKWVDLNQDGLLDIAMNGIYSYTDWKGIFYLNRGDGEFELSNDSIEELKYPEMVFGDLDGDLDVDMVFTGRWDYQDYRCQIFENKYNIENTAPTAPSNFQYTMEGDVVTFTWDEATDEESNVTYNLRVGTTSGSDNIFNSMNDNTSNNRLVANSGNMTYANTFTCRLSESATMYASVQAIDNSYIASDFSNEVSFEYVGIEEFSARFNVFPNPSTGIINIDLENIQNAELEIYNSIGQTIYKNTEFTKTQIDLSEYDEGIYFIKIKIDNNNYISKFVLNK